MKKSSLQEIVVTKSVYAATYDDYLPVQYQIDVDDACITSISEESARYIYEQLGKLLTVSSKQ
ncbi:MAG: hypothetical protein LBS20_10855 [Prevotella sp.]|jgi:hypothetical protein|nr:hypothetical protein [Prevotella sp.]